MVVQQWITLFPSTYSDLVSVTKDPVPRVGVGLCVVGFSVRTKCGCCFIPMKVWSGLGVNSFIFTGNWSKNSQVVFSFECSGFSFFWYYERGITFDNEIPLEKMMIRRTIAMRTKDGDWQCVFIIVEKWTVILCCMGIESAKTWHFDTSSDHRLPRMAKSFSVASLPCLWYNYINAAIDLQLLRCVRPSRVCLTLFCLFRRRILELSFLYA